MLSLRLLSTLLLPTRLALELRRLHLLVSFGSAGDRPDARAKRLRTSVREMTPQRWPESFAPGSAPSCAAVSVEGVWEVTDVMGGALGLRELDELEVLEFWPLGGGDAVSPCGRITGGPLGGGASTEGTSAGVGGPDEAGDGASTIHILCHLAKAHATGLSRTYRCDRVATSFATVCARVE